MPGKSHDILFVGTGTSLMAYDVERNADVFYKEVPDGVSSITFGTIKGVAGSNPLVIVGGHCSIQVRHVGCDGESSPPVPRVGDATLRRCSCQSLA